MYLLYEVGGVMPNPNFVCNHLGGFSDISAVYILDWVCMSGELVVRSDSGHYVGYRRCVSERKCCFLIALFLLNIWAVR